MRFLFAFPECFPALLPSIWWSLSAFKSAHIVETKLYNKISIKLEKIKCVSVSFWVGERPKKKRENPLDHKISTTQTHIIIIISSISRTMIIIANKWKTTNMAQHFNQMRPQHQEAVHPQGCWPCVGLKFQWSHWQQPRGSEEPAGKKSKNY